jgi:hypothetical protein
MSKSDFAHSLSQGLERRMVAGKRKRRGGTTHEVATAVRTRT